MCFNADKPVNFLSADCQAVKKALDSVKLPEQPLCSVPICA
ncbi:MAG: hypothetical protein RR219_09645 [Clostridiales bacterium]